MQKISLLYKWFDPVGSVVINQMSLLGGSKKQGLYKYIYIFFRWKDYKGETDHTLWVDK